MNPEPRLPKGCSGFAPDFGSWKVVTRIWTMAGRALSANWTKARLRRSSSVSPSVSGASRQIGVNDFANFSSAERASGRITRTKRNKIDLAIAITVEPPGRVIAIPLSKTNDEDKWSQDTSIAVRGMCYPAEVTGLAEKIILVTGGTSGLGRALTRALAE